MNRGLHVSQLYVRVEDREILKGIDLTVEPEKSMPSWAPTAAANRPSPFDGRAPELRGDRRLGAPRRDELLGLGPDKRAKAGLFLSFQYPAAIPGVSVANFLRTARQAVRPDDLTPPKFRKLIFDKLDVLEMDPAFLGRYVNDGFSGGEKSASRCCSWRCWHRSMRSSTRPTPASTSTRCAPSAVGQRAARNGRRARHGLSDHHPLPAHPRTHRARRRAHDDRRTHGQDRRSRTGAHDRA